MRRLLLSTLLPLAVALIPANVVVAQPWGVGLGYYSGPPFSSPVIGIFPQYYRGFYGNGMSMYGPPVPTFSPVPGTYNGSDYTTTQMAPLLPLNPGFYLAGSNSSYYRDVTPLSPLLPKAEPKAVLSPPATANMLVVEVHLPVAAADVFVDGNPTKSTGEVRMYSSPVLPAGENYSFQIRAEWIENGQKVSQTRITGGKANEKVIVDFVDK